MGFLAHEEGWGESERGRDDGTGAGKPRELVLLTLEAKARSFAGRSPHTLLLSPQLRNKLAPHHQSTQKIGFSPLTSRMLPKSLDLLGNR